MKKFILALTLILCGYTLSQASIITKNSLELQVGSNPASILKDPNSGIINIFCAGVDANGNNKYDEGEDEKASWWTYDPTGSSTEASKVKEFDNFFVSPLKPSITTEDGKTLVGISFKCDIVDNLYSGETKSVIYKANDQSLYTSVTLNDSEYLYFEQTHDQGGIKILRKIGNDVISLMQAGASEVKEHKLDGDASDFTFTDLDEDGTMELIVLVDNKLLEFFSLKEGITLKETIDLSEKDSYTGKFGHLYSYGKYIYTTFNDNGALFRATYNMDNTLKTIVLAYPEPTPHSSFYPLNDNISVTTGNGFDITVLAVDPYKDIEMHRTSTPTNIVYSDGNMLYVGGPNKVYLYDITNEPNIDPSLVAQTYTGYQPLDLFPFNDTLYSVNLGVDFNFNGAKDLVAGDQKASINMILPYDIAGSFFLFGKKQIDFDFPINFPLNTNISTDGDIILPSGNMAYYYNVADNEVFDSLDAEAYVTCSFRVLDYLVLGLRDATDGKSYVRIKKGDFIDVKTEVGKNVVDLTVYQNASGFGVLSVSEGTFGEADAKLNILKLSTMGFGDNISIDIGKTASAVVTNEDQTKAAVVMNGSHEIHIIDLLTDKKVLTFSTGTTGYGGPRDAKFVGDSLFVTTYSNQVLIFDSKTGTKITSLALDGNSEGLYLNDRYLFATNVNYSNYQPNNRVFAYKLDKITGVENSPMLSQETIRVYPNPVVNDFHLVSDDLAGANNIVIINSTGKIVATHSGHSDGAIALNAHSLGLDAGTYTAVINGERTVRFIVIK